MDYLSITGRYIYITPSYKVINPTHDAQFYKYSGPVENYEFKNQRKNFDILQSILKDNPLVHIYAGRFMGDKSPKTTFIAHTKDRRIWWRKYEGMLEGSGSNIIIEDGKNYKLSSWIKKKTMFSNI